MKNQRKLIVLSILILAFILYLSDVTTAMAEERPEQDIAGTSASEQFAEPEAGSDVEPEPETIAGPGEEPGASEEAGPESVTGSVEEPGASEEAGPESVAGPVEEPGASEEAGPETIAGSGEEPRASEEAGPESVAGSAEEPGASVEPETNLLSMTMSERHMEFAAEPDSASTAEEFQAWMEAHTNTGGLLKLTDNITLSGSHVFISAGPGCPRVFVDTDGHTITITGEVEFWNDGHLTFLGGAENSVVFRVAEGGMLNLNHISVKYASGEQSSEADTPYLLWQEEGAGLVVSGCQISGEIHYADMPFVIYENTVSVIVEEGQQAVLPAEIACDVNYRGQVSRQELMPVSWNLAGKEQHQAERMRFQVSGYYSGAASLMPPRCTVIYNDYPLTFTEVQASAGKNAYIFRCGYTKSEHLQPMTIVSEYSLDGENWFLYEESEVSKGKNVFPIILTVDQWNTAENPYLYLRLQCGYEGVRYFSNVLRFAADNLEDAADQGGGRGGGTSIVNPPKEPERNPGDASSDGAALPVMKPDGSGSGLLAKPNGGNDTSEGSVNSGNDISEEAENNGNGTPAESEDNGNGSPAGPESGESHSAVSDCAPASDEQNSLEKSQFGNRESSFGHDADIWQSSDGESENMPGIGEAMNSAPQPESEASEKAEHGAAEREDGREEPVDMQPSAAESQDIEEALVSSFGRNLAIAAGFAGLSATVGAAGFCVHAGIFRRLLQAMVKWFR